MIPYLVYLTFVIILGLICPKNQKGERFFWVTTCAVLIIFTGLRGYRVGSDTYTYILSMQKYSGQSFSQVFFHGGNFYGFEPGYQLFTKLCGFLNFDPSLFLIAVACMIYIPFWNLMKKYSIDPVQSVLIYFAFGMFYFSLGIFRQMIALSICLLSVPFILKRETLKFSLMIVLAMLFHYTAICWVLVYIIFALDLKDIFNRLVVPISICFLLFGPLFVKMILNFFPRYQSYIGTDRAAMGGSYLMLILLAGIYVFCRIFFCRRDDLSEVEKLCCVGLDLSVILQSLSYSFGLMGRAVVFYTVFLTLTMPFMVKRCFQPSSRRIATVIFSSVWIYMIIFEQFLGNKYICPFVFFWEQM